MITLPPAVDGRNLVGVFSIRRNEWADDIRLGSMLIGDIQTITTWQTRGKEQVEVIEYCFTPANEIEPFPLRTTYEACWFDILTLVANNQDLAIEFTVRVHNKIKKSVPNTCEVPQNDID